MTALWDWRVWSDATCLLSRSRLASSRDVTSFSSRHTSSSRCCCWDCHCKANIQLLCPGEEKKECSDVRVSYFFYASLKHVSTADFMFALVLLQLQLSFGVVFCCCLVNTMRSKQWHHESHLQTKFHTTCSTFTTEAVCGVFLFCFSSKYYISFCCLLMYIFL